MLEQFQVGYVRALAKVGKPLEDAFLEAVGPDTAAEAERLWKEERKQTEMLKQSSQPTAPATPFQTRASLRGKGVIAAIIGGMT